MITLSRSVWPCEDQTRDRHARAPMGNYMIANPSNLGNFMISDSLDHAHRGFLRRRLRWSFALLDVLILVRSDMALTD